MADSHKLTARERELVAATVAGQELVCSHLAPDQLAESDDPEHAVRAEVIRDLLLGRHGDSLDPRGLRVTGARITGQLDLAGLHSPIALALNRCWFQQVLVAREAHLPSSHLIGSHIPALHADGLRVDGGLFLRGGFTASAASEIGAVRLVGAHIGGALDCDGATLTNTTGPALHADRLRVDGNVLLGGGFTAAGAGELGAVRLRGAHIGDTLACNGATLTNTAGPALHADGMQIDGGLFLRGGFTASAASELGAVRLMGAHIGGSLRCDGATLTNTTGPALHADRLRVDDNVVLSGGFTASAASEIGAVRLMYTHISGNLDCGGATLTNTAGLALAAEGMRVDGSVLLRDGFTARGRGELATVRLASSSIGRLLDFRGDVELDNPSGPILDLRSTTTGVVRLPAATMCASTTRDPSCRREHQILVDNFTYPGLDPAGAGWRQWLHWLRHHTRSYAAQPYQHLAATQKAAGHDTAARHILIAQQQDLRARGDLGSRWARARHWLWGALAGYGYRTGRTATALLTVLLLAGALADTPPPTTAATPPCTPPAPNTPTHPVPYSSRSAWASTADSPSRPLASATAATWTPPAPPAKPSPPPSGHCKHWCGSWPPSPSPAIQASSARSPDHSRAPRERLVI